jgi:hypothetical protein
VTIVLVVGARPNFVKIAPILARLRACVGVHSVLVHTGQHHDDALSGSFFRDLEIPQPDVHLGVTSGTAPERLADMIARLASIFFQLATNGGNEALAKALPTRAKSDALLDARLKAPFPGDANDILYQWESSDDYNPSAGLERIQAAVLAINSTDDERYPAELGILEREIRRVKTGRVLLIPASPDTAGHGTTGSAKWYQRELGEVLQSAPRL